MPIVTSLTLSASAFMTVKIPKSLGITDDMDINVKWTTLYWKDKDGDNQEYTLTEFEEGYDYEVDSKRPEVEVGDTTDSEDEDDESEEETEPVKPKKDTSKEEPNICLFCDDVNDKYPLQCKNCYKYPCCEDETAQCMEESIGTYGYHSIPLCEAHKIKNGFDEVSIG